jgi:hypothetical protein
VHADGTPTTRASTIPAPTEPALATAAEPSAGWLRRLLAVDAVVGTLGGIAVTAWASSLAPALDVGTGVVVAIGLLFVVAGIVNGWAARDGARPPTLLAVDLDVVGAIVSVGLLLQASPTPFGTVLLVSTAAWTAGIAAIKLIGLRARAGGGGTRR